MFIKNDRVKLIRNKSNIELYWILLRQSLGITPEKHGWKLGDTGQITDGEKGQGSVIHWVCVKQDKSGYEMCYPDDCFEQIDPKNLNRYQILRGNMSTKITAKTWLISMVLNIFFQTILNIFYKRRCKICKTVEESQFMHLAWFDRRHPIKIGIKKHYEWMCHDCYQKETDNVNSIRLEKEVGFVWAR